MSTRTVFSTYAPPTWVRDTNCFAYSYDLTGAAVYVQGSLSYNKSALLISNKHVVFAAHTMGTPTTPFEIKFVNGSNQVFTYNVTSVDTVTDTDIMIGVLDTTVDSSLKIYKVLPSTFETYYGTATDKENNPLSTIYLTVNNEGYQKNCSVGDAQFQFPSLAIYISYDTERKNAGEYAVSGDSGNPIFTIIDNELILLGLWYTGSGKNKTDPLVSGDTIGGFPSLNQYISSINTIMTTLAGTSYSLSQKSLSNYKTYSTNKIPTIHVSSPTYDRTPTITGRGAVSSTITVYDGVSSLGTTTTTSTGEWTFTPASNLTITTHTLTATSTLSGNTSDASDPVTVVINSVPTPSVSSPSSTYDPTPDITGTLTYISGYVNKIYVYDSETLLGTTTTVDGNWTFTVTDVLSITSHTIKAKLSLETGGSSVAESSLSSPFTLEVVKPSPPTLTFTSPTSDTTPTVTGTSLANSLILVYIDDVFKAPTTTSDGSGNFTWTPDSAISIGSHTIQATQRPYFGNTSDKSSPQTLEIT
jgi:hypothetical protein